MAAVNKDRARYVSPVGYEVFDKGVATEDIPAGTPCVQSASGWSIAPAGSTDFGGVSAKPYYAGQGGCDFMIQGEMDGFSGLTVGAGVFVSGTVAGGWDTTAPTDAVLRARAVTATRIRVNCV